jgi:hypothetical protein
MAKELTVWLSHTDDYEDFAEDVNDSDSFSLTIPSTNDAKWVGAIESLLIGTSGDEWRIGSTKLDLPLTATNFSVKLQCSYGSGDMQPVVVNNSILFVDFVGRKIREIVYNSNEQKYTAPDLLTLCEHISLGGIKEYAYQRNPESILWCVLNNGDLFSLTYNREQNVIAASRHPMAGTVNSICIIPSTTEDEIWLNVTRTLNTGNYSYIEQMQPRYFATQADCYFVDCGIKYDGVPATTFTGLDHLNGETVKILADGAVFTEQVVVGGQITISQPASKVAIGLPYTYKLQPNRIDISSAGGTTHGSIKKIPELVISFLKTLNAKYGASDSELFDIDWRSIEDYDSPPVLFSGDKVVVLDGGFDIEAPIIISGDDPTPCTVRAIIARIEKTGR